MNTNAFLLILLLVLGLLLPFLIFLIRNLRNILPYLYLTARIRAKEARLLKQDTLDDMINSASVAEIASMLENSEYAFAMQGLVLESSESIEDVLIRQTADIYSEIAGMIPAKLERVFSFLNQQWDVRNIKTIIRGVRKGLPSEALSAKIVPFGEMDIEILKKMAESMSIEDLLPLFEETPYAPVTGMVTTYEQSKSLLPIEAILDKTLLEGMWNSVVSDSELSVLQDGLGARIDVLNLKIIFRAKRDRLLFSDIEHYIVAGGNLQKSVFATMVFDEVDEVGALFSDLEATLFYKPLMEVLPQYEKDGSLALIEKVLDETALLVGKETSIKQPYGVAPILGYLSLKDCEIRNIRAISRAKEAGMTPEKIREFVLKV
jgi:V/A-type H+-transporting ATPase subunit C